MIRQRIARDPRPVDLDLRQRGDHHGHLAARPARSRRSRVPRHDRRPARSRRPSGRTRDPRACEGPTRGRACCCRSVLDHRAGPDLGHRARELVDRSRAQRPVAELFALDRRRSRALRRTASSSATPGGAGFAMPMRRMPLTTTTGTARLPLAAATRRTQRASQPSPASGGPRQLTGHHRELGRRHPIEAEGSRDGVPNPRVVEPQIAIRSGSSSRRPSITTRAAITLAGLGPVQVGELGPLGRDHDGLGTGQRLERRVCTMRAGTARGRRPPAAGSTRARPRRGREPAGRAPRPATSGCRRCPP